MKQFYISILFCFFANFLQAQYFELQVKTTTANESFTIPTNGSYTYDYNVEIYAFGNQNPIATYNNVTGDLTHTFGSANDYFIRILDGSTFPAIRFFGSADRLKVVAINNWGNIQWSTMEQAFEGCENLVLDTSTAPDLSNVTSTQRMFRDATSLVDRRNRMGDWDMSNVQNMSQMFRGCSVFNSDLSGWDTSSAQTFTRMFQGATAFDQNLGDWDISNLASSGTDAIFASAGVSTSNYDETIIGWGTITPGETRIPSGLNIRFDNSTYCTSEAARTVLSGGSFNWNFIDSGLNCSAVNDDVLFITTWETTTANETITIPTGGSNLYGYYVDWGDGQSNNSVSGDISHTYNTPGLHTVRIGGLFPRIIFNNSGDRSKIKSVEQWGNIIWRSMESAFYGCESLVINATDAPDLTFVTTFFSAFRACLGIGSPDLNQWDVSNVGEMANMFLGSNFNGNITNWDVGSVFTFGSMFYRTPFNQDISGWNIGERVTEVFSMAEMFAENSAFNYSLDAWDVSKVQAMRNMFNSASNFNQSLASWDISNVTLMNGMLNNSGLSRENYDATLIGWTTLENGETQIPTGITLGAGGLHYCEAIDAKSTLENAPYNWTITDAGISCTDNAFITTWQTTTANESITIPTAGSGYDYIVDWGDGTIETNQTGDASHTYATAGTYTVEIYGDFPRIYFNDSGDKSKILTVEQWGTNVWTSMNSAFDGCNKLVLNADDTPDLSSVTSMERMFRRTFNLEDLKDMIGTWNTENVVNMDSLFRFSGFNENINSWNVSNVQDMAFIFGNTSQFNQPLDNWDVRNVTSLHLAFATARKFNQDISSWKLQSIANTIGLENLFVNASDFNQDLGALDLSYLPDNIQFSSFFVGTSMSQENYEATLIGWSTLDTAAGETRIPRDVPLTSTGLTYCQAASERQSLIINQSWTITGDTINCTETDKFITIWQTTTANESITVRTSGAGYDYTVEWGDGTTTNETGDATHTYTTAGTHTVKISGAFPQLFISNTSSIDNKLQSVEQWGTGKWSSFDRAFEGARNVVINATDIPDLSNVTTMFEAFKDCESLVDNGGQMQHWDVSTIENFVSMFQGAILFDENLGNWDLSSARTLANMLDGSNLSSSNYDATLIGWAENPNTPNNLGFGAIGLQYCLAEAARTTLDVDKSWGITDAGLGCNDDTIAFITTWRTTSANESITIPTTGVGYDYFIDWGDGTTDASQTGNATHQYATAGDYQVKIWGSFPRIYFNNGGNRNKIRSIDQWGIITWSSMANAFYGCNLLTYAATDAPDLSSVTDMSRMFSLCTNFEATDLSNWNVSTAESMSYMFSGASKFNGDITNWDVSKVQGFDGMFENAVAFNRDISNWNLNTSADVNLGAMFNGATIFDQPIGKWNTSKVVGTNLMFRNSTAFDQDLGDWDISSMERMSLMFFGSGLSTENYDNTLIGWATLDTGSGETQIPTGITFSGGSSRYCFGETARNTLISAPFNWSISDGGLGCAATDFFITTWRTNTDNVEITIPTTGGGYSYSVNWGDGTIETGFTGNATHTYTSSGIHRVQIYGDFPRIYFNNTGSKDIIVSIDQWGSQQWSSMQGAFYGCSALELNVSDTPNLSQATSLERMFMGTTDIVDNEASVNSWDTSTITNMSYMFANSIFDFNISSWDVGKVENFTGMFSSNSVFDQNIDGWNIGEFVTGTINMQAMFDSASNYNSPLNSWDISKVTNMASMFGFATAFNQPLDAWDTETVENMGGMFFGASDFDQNVGDWNLSSITSMSSMFQQSGLSTQNYDKILIGWATQNAGETIPSGIDIRFEGTQYCFGAEARNILTDNNGLNWSISDDGAACTATDFFITTWQTTSDNESITIPTTGTGYNYDIDWGDGTIEFGNTANASHSYDVAGTYTVKIIGDFPRFISLGSSVNNRLKIQTIEQWGTIAWQNMRESFVGCNNLDVTAIDAPDLSSVTDMSSMFFACFNLQSPDFSGWDTSGITDMTWMFLNANNFNGDISTWDVGSVTDFTLMLAGASSFNQDISGWNIGENVSGTIIMENMLANTSNFDQNLGAWDLQKVTDIRDMLNNSGLSIANYDATLIGWAANTNTPNDLVLGAGGLRYCLGETARNILTDINGLNWTITDAGLGCTPTDFFITTWQTDSTNESITIPTTGRGYSYSVDWGDGTVEGGFTGNASHRYATAGTYTVRIIGDFPRIYFKFSNNQEEIRSIEQWGTQQWTSMEAAFEGCGNLVLNADDTPDLSSVQNLSEMFSRATNFVDQKDIMNTWDVGTITDFSLMFSEASRFNENINGWNIGENVTGSISMEEMFNSASLYNQPLNDWDMSKVMNLKGMFKSAFNFDQPLNNWDTGNVQTMEDMFFLASKFDQSIGDWNLSNTFTLFGILNFSGISTGNYDATLIGWAEQGPDDTIISNRNLGTIRTTYCQGEDARNTLTSAPYNWTITDNGLANNCDNTPPVITLLGDNPQEIPEGSGYTELGATTDDGSQVVIDDSEFRDEIGTYTIYYNATDASGNMAVEVTRTVNVVDTTAPVITLNGANPQTIELGAGYTELGATTDDGSVVSIDTLEFMDAVGSYTIYYDATDAAGNPAIQVTRMVDVVDTTAPVITLNGANPQTIELGAGYTELGATTDDGSAVSIDTLEFMDAVGSYTIYYDATDAAGNPAIQVTRTVDVVDTTAPVITLNGANPQTIELGAGYTELGATTDDDSAVSIDTLEFMDAVGSYTIYYDATDATGNPAIQVTRTVDVVDTTAPVITLNGANPQTIELGAGYTELGATTDDGSVVSIDTLELMDAVGSYTIYYDATDAAGNPAIQVTRTVDVVDTTAPVITLNGANPQTIELGAGYTELGATTDDGSTVSIDTLEFMDAVGSYTIYYDATDAIGNAAIQVTRTVDVVDTTNPTVVCQNITVQLDDAGNASITAAMVDNGSSDLSGIASLAIDTIDFDCSNLGDNTVILTAIDNNGNSNTCAATVLVEDSLDPIFNENTLPENVEIVLDGMTTYELEDFTLGIEVADNCDSNEAVIATIIQDPIPGTLLPIGEHIISFTITDSSNNIAIASFIVSVTAVLGVDDNLADVVILYPNPTKGIVHLGTEADKVVVNNVAGQKVKEVSTTTSIDLSELPQGVYFARILKDNKQNVVRLVKE